MAKKRCHRNHIYFLFKNGQIFMPLSRYHELENVRINTTKIRKKKILRRKLRPPIIIKIGTLGTNLVPSSAVKKRSKAFL